MCNAGDVINGGYIVGETIRYLVTFLQIYIEEWISLNLILRYNFNETTSLYSYVSVNLEYYYISTNICIMNRVIKDLD